MVLRILRLLANARVVLWGFLIISILSLTAALISEHVFGLRPCQLCIYQRYPFVVVIGISIAGLMIARHSTLGAMGVIALCALTFAVNAGIAFHHTGVEQGWWSSFSAGCKVDVMPTGSVEDILRKLESEPAVPCDKIPWQDPVLGLSMAAHNTLLNIGLFVISLISIALINRTRSPKLDIRA